VTRTAIVAILTMALAFAGCESAPADGQLPLLIASTSIVGDLVSEVAGTEAQVEVLIPIGADPHDFAPSARQAASLREADLVVTSGLGLEAGLADALAAAVDEGVPTLELGPALDPRPLGGVGSGTLDPHWWLDPIRAARGAGLIAERLAEISAGDWASRAAELAAELEVVDSEMRTSLAVVPPEHRTLITSHDAFGYFAERYDFEIIGVLIPGGATQAAPDPRAIAALAAVIRDEGVPAIFGETTLSTNVADALAAEVGSEIQVVILYTGSLGEPGSGADTYRGLLLTNVERIVAALGQDDA
jgi:zinc/manganese transport system substrate-binding protein